ncbi:16S rRNA (uracil(1498)-N(3))-methyltransferase [Salibacterium salarium]|uniref:Ribosomal RNA small subunit methyltransferase E n=1 Tax=Salibacterium salarium TaxID=284579 RepID=A0A3R9Q1B5_9BACI|nr:16S rRNA (uracil(1498)-N(3))-methyltransferase [Salibacterium salarium]RSL31527.1 16S rRNA (uracil(1498)-N(3))-methyltransferase [Salibacterium salarium]
MQRYFVDPEQMTDTKVFITGDDVKHVVKVMRLDIGDKMICLNNKGRQVYCAITAIEKEQVQADILEDLQDNPELPVDLSIAQALIKGDKLDLVVQKGTELGAHTFYVFYAERSVVKWDSNKVEKKIERLHKIAKEAAEQAGRLFIPSIIYCSGYENMMETATNHETCIYLYEEQAKMNKHNGLVDVLYKHPSSLLAVIGPEGGISEKEASAYNNNNFHQVSLGPRIVRSETASLYLLSVLSYNYELLR